MTHPGIRPCYLFSIFVFLSSPSGRSQPEQVVSPLEVSGFAALTSYDSLQAFLQRLDGMPGIKVERIAVTHQGRAVSVVRVSSSRVFGSDRSKVRVLLFAQQHGDEPAGKEALTLLLAGLASGEYRRILTRVDLLIVPQMNPDGAELRQRRTADSIDLNRNHVLLTSPATGALHDLFYTWMPHVTMDIHEYGSFSSSWSDSGFIKTADVQLGMLTNLNTSPAVRELQHEKIFPAIAQRMNREGYSFQEYIVGSPGDRIRHSTTEINDGRQSFGILGTISFIQEGRKWKTLEDQLQRRARSQLASIKALLKYCAGHAREIRQVVQKERSRLAARAGQSVALRMDHGAGSGELTIPVRMVASDRDTTWRVKIYHGEVKLVKAALLPERYTVERKDSSVIALLLRHHIKVETVRRERHPRGSFYLIDSVGQTVLEEDTLPLLSVTRRKGNISVKPGDFTVSTRQIQSVLLEILLEPESVWGLTKYGEFSSLRKGRRYPIGRIP